MITIGNDWDKYLSEEFSKNYFKQLVLFIRKEYKEKVIYPYYANIFISLKYTSFKDTRVVIIGQDPYHEYGQANGLCFSVNKGIKIPPSLRNIFLERKNDLGIEISESGDLSSWAKQGVLLLNNVLTVQDGCANSHKGIGWEIFTDCIISKLNEKKDPVIFLIWGSDAKKKSRLITNPLHYKLICSHPSPLSAYKGFIGCKHFSKTNQILMQNGLKPIDWNN